MPKRRALAALIALTACNAAPGETTDGPTFIDGFTPAPAPAGHTRYVTPTIPQVKPGEDVMYCQWLAPASTEEQEVVDITGEQSKYGHHIVLYATAMNMPVGTSRKCTDTDMLSVRFIGGIGGEGATAIKLPAGYAYRIPKGFALMANVHYVNVGRSAIQGQGVVDVQLRAPQENSKLADIMTNIDTGLVVPPGASTKDVRCTVEKEITAIMWANHVHEWGTSAYSEIERADGTVELLTRDDPWAKESTYNPKFRTWPEEAPLVFHPGDVIHTHCEYNNDTGGDLTFGPEMCVGIAFYTRGGTGMLVCDGGSWSQQ